MSTAIRSPAPPAAAPAPAPSPAAAGRATWLALLCALVPYGLLVWRFDFVCDDAYISFRYARHLAEGHGLVFNVGEAPVEGFSNLLWTLAMAGFEALGVDVTLAARGLSVLCGLCLLGLVARFAARRAARPALAAAVATLTLATLPPFAVWSTGGLETMAFALCAFGVLERVFAPPRPGAPPGITGRAPAALGAAAWLVPMLLLRADGMLWAALLVGAAGLGFLRARADVRARGLATLAALGVVVLIVLVPLTVWRMATFDDWIANTARAKGSVTALTLERGAFYVGTLVLAVPSLALMAVTALAVPAGAADARNADAGRGDGRAWRAAALWFALGGAAYAVAAGGDFMAFGRFLVPVLAPLALVFAAAVDRALAGDGVPARAAGGALAVGALTLSSLAAFDVVPVPRAWRERLFFRWNGSSWQSEVEMWEGMRDRARAWSLQGRAIADCTAPGESMIGFAIGAIGYHSEIVLYDMFGLVDRDVARRPVARRRMSPGHDRLVGWEYFLPRDPTYFGSHLTTRDASLDEGLGPGFAGSPLSELIDVERCPLDPALGYPPDAELRLFRFR